MRRVLGLLCVFLFFLPLCQAEETAPASFSGTRRALLIGCDRFLTQSNTTPSSQNNVRRMAEILSGGTMALQSLVTAETGVATIPELAALIREAFSDATEQDISYFYISTHGVWNSEDNGQVTLLLSDGITETPLTAYALRHIFDTVKGKKVLLLDACHAGAMIGKGVDSSFSNVFRGDEYVLVCSSGGMEESWYWSGLVDGERLAGAGYFSGALAEALDVQGSYGADDNRDGLITLTELKRRLLLSHGASTVRTYPEESDFPLLTYDPGSVTGHRRAGLIEGISFSADALSATQPVIDFSFNVVRATQVAYQIVYQKNGVWDFDGSQLIYDNNGDFGPYALPGRTLNPGMKERSLSLEGQSEDPYGYVLVQVLTIDRGLPSVAWSKVLCVPPLRGDPELSFELPEGFCPEIGEELTFLVRHSVPVEMTVTIENAEGETVRRLGSRLASRPEQIPGGGTSLTWTGLDAQGQQVPSGQYRVKIRAYLGEERYEAYSPWFSLTEPVG